MRIAACLLALLCAPALAAPPVPVNSRPLSELAIHPQREASAQAVSLNLAKLPAELAARIDSIPVEPGQRIAKGAVVAKLDCADARIAAQRAEAALESAQARLKLAQLQLQRSKELAASNFISGDALDTRQTEVAVVAAEVKLNTAARAAAQREVGKCTLRSPYPAIVEARLAQVGEMASPGTPIVQLWDTSRLQLSVQLQADDADQVAQARPVFVSQGREYAVKLLRVSPAVNRTSRTREARFSFARPRPRPAATACCAGAIRAPSCRRTTWSAAQASSGCLSSAQRPRASCPCPALRKAARRTPRPCRPTPCWSPTAAWCCRTAWPSPRADAS
jgi:RND family efflux transporter MFP subunit